MKTKSKRRIPNIPAMPAKYSRIVDAVMAEDAKYFRTHPGVTEYCRDYVPGEFYPHNVPIVSMVRVCQIEPGFRTREAIDMLSGGL